MLVDPIEDSGFAPFSVLIGNRSTRCKEIFEYREQLLRQLGAGWQFLVGPVAVDQSGNTMHRITPGLRELVGELPSDLSLAVPSSIAPSPSIWFPAALTAPSTLDHQIPSHSLKLQN